MSTEIPSGARAHDPIPWGDEPPGRGGDCVLIVDDIPDNLALLHDALDESGYTVIVATNGETALQRALQAQPDIVLLDAVMPGMDGFEVARQLKASSETTHIPIIFMTGLSETEHVVAAFQAGGSDYVVKPIRPREVLARIETHLHSARAARAARNALDAFGHAALVLRPDSAQVVWQTPLARQLMQAHFGNPATVAPPELCDWVRQALARAPAEPGSGPPTWVRTEGARRLSFALHESTGEGEWMLVMRESNDSAQIEALVQAFKLTTREAEVLYWVVRGKTNRDIGDILGSSAATVKKQLEHVYAKLGVETRTAAAGKALARVSTLGQG